jgi:hypothetical protein
MRFKYKAVAGDPEEGFDRFFNRMEVGDDFELSLRDFPPDGARAYGTELYSTYGRAKSAFVENLIRVLKRWTWQHFTSTSTRRWVDILPQLIQRWNNHYHRTLGMSPWDASDPDNQEALMAKLYPPLKEPERPPKFKIGDAVRVSRTKGVFEKEHDMNWRGEVYIVRDVKRGVPNRYYLADQHGEPIDGGFYEAELQKSRLKDFWSIETILKTRGKGARKEYLCKFIGYPASFNNWVPASQVEDVGTAAA